PELNLESGVSRQINVQPGAETDQPEPLASFHRIPLFHPADNPSGNQPGDLDHQQPNPFGGFEQQGILFVGNRSLIQVGAEEFSPGVSGIYDSARQRAAVY